MLDGNARHKLDILETDAHVSGASSSPASADNRWHDGKRLPSLAPPTYPLYCLHWQVDTPVICAILGGIVVAFYLLKMYTLVEMRRMETQRREALNKLKAEVRPETAESEAHSYPVTPSTQHGNMHEEQWDVTDY